MDPTLDTVLRTILDKLNTPPFNPFEFISFNNNKTLGCLVFKPQNTLTDAFKTKIFYIKFLIYSNIFLNFLCHMMFCCLLNEYRYEKGNQCTRKGSLGGVKEQYKFCPLLN